MTTGQRRVWLALQAQKWRRARGPVALPPPPTLLTDLAAYWNLDEEDDLGVLMRADELGFSDLSPESSAIVSSSGVINNAARFTGGATGLVGSSSHLSVAGDFAVALWFYLGVYGDWQVAFHLQNSVTAEECFRIQMQGPFDVNGDAVFVLFDGVGGGFTNVWLLPDQWHHLVVSVAGDTLGIYANGELADIVALSGSRPTPNEVRIGGNAVGYGWNGAIDEVGFWNRALSANEVGQLYNYGSGLPFENF